MSEREPHTEPMQEEQLPENLMEYARLLGFEGEEAEKYVRTLLSGKGMLISAGARDEGRGTSKIDAVYDPSIGMISSKE